MSDDLVKRAREWNFCWPSHDVEMLVPAMADHIEELEAKLAKAVEALGFYADPTYNGYDVCVGDYGLSMTTGCIIQDGGEIACQILAELKGQGDE